MERSSETVLGSKAAARDGARMQGKQEMMSNQVILILLLFSFHQNLLAFSTPSPGDANSSLPLNWTQMKGTHNSYHMRRLIFYLSEWDYTFPPLDVQAARYNIRAFELDLHVSYDNDGLQVYHIYGLDDKSNCKKFVRCLAQLRRFSDSHPRHSPLFVFLQIKEMAGGLPFDHFELLESNIKTYLGDRIVTPDELQGHAQSLKAAVLRKGWPTVGQMAGRIFFILHTTRNNHAKKYTHNFTSLKGRVMFAKATEDQVGLPWALFTHVSAERLDKIAELKRKGLMVLTSGCLAKTPRSKCSRKKRAARRSGANIIKEDNLEGLNSSGL